VASKVIASGTGTSGPIRVFEEVLVQARIDAQDIVRMVATGYGRMTFKGVDRQISEITCHARGVSHLVPTARTIIDIGGQDAKIIKISDKGKVLNFLMNDKCAAGTGRFLEVMSRVLETTVDQLGSLGSKSAKAAAISSTCTVFAESEVISQLAAGILKEDIAAGVHQAVARRVAGLARRVGIEEDVILTGGVAQNPGVLEALGKQLKTMVKSAPIPQFTGALGAAIIAWEEL